MENDTAFEMATSNIRFGFGVTREVGMDMADMGVEKVMVVTDRNMAKSDTVNIVLESLDREKIRYSLFEKVQVEPTDISFKEAIKFAEEGKFEGFIGVGGGSSMDTAKAANLYATHPADFLDYVNAPIGKGKPIPGPVKPLIAIPTTSGTGSETTGVAIFDLVEMHAKTGIASRYLKPTLGIIDPNNTRSLPPAVVASTGLDVLTHALESYTAIPYTGRPLPARPNLRPAYQGSNPISDLWALQALEMMTKNLARIYEDPSDDEARAQMLLAASFAGIGFGNAGVHLPHGMAYPVGGMVRDFIPPGYPVNYPLVPHGMAVVLNAPAVFRFTGPANPERHLRAAQIMGANISTAKAEDAGKILAGQIIDIMQRVNMPNGLSALGYSKDDIPDLVKGTLPQHRVTKLSPRPADEEELTALFEDALKYW